MSQKEIKQEIRKYPCYIRNRCDNCGGRIHYVWNRTIKPNPFHPDTLMYQYTTRCSQCGSVSYHTQYTPLKNIIEGLE